MTHSVKAVISPLTLSVCLAFVSCGRGDGSSVLTSDSTAVAHRLYEDSQRLLTTHQEDSALTVMLQAADYVGGCHNDTTKYNIFSAIASAYERKNLFNLQEKYLRRRLETALAMDDAYKTADSYFTLGVSLFAQGEDSLALQCLSKAYVMAPADSAQFHARCQLMRGQVFLQKEATDSVAAALHLAMLDCPGIERQELYHLTEVYLLHYQGKDDEAVAKIEQNLETDSLYARVEQLGLLMSIDKEHGRLREALDDAGLLLELNDSVMFRETSASMAKIHQLQHEEQMRLAAARQETLKAHARARVWALLALLSAVVALALAVVTLMRRRVVAARQSELEALQLAEDAQRNEAETRALNEDLQKRYYEHLYAIILPILNAKRNNSGHIDLNEKSWQLIEQNTNLVLPRFTRQLRKNHPSLTDEDVRFCCLIAMRVPNPVIANIYAIAPASVAVRKQRMKKKLDECVAKETLETYLSKYSL